MTNIQEAVYTSPPRRRASYEEVALYYSVVAPVIASEEVPMATRKGLLQRLVDANMGSDSDYQTDFDVEEFTEWYRN